MSQVAADYLNERPIAVDLDLLITLYQFVAPPSSASALELRRMYAAKKIIILREIAAKILQVALLDRTADSERKGALAKAYHAETAATIHMLMGLQASIGAIIPPPSRSGGGASMRGGAHRPAAWMMLHARELRPMFGPGVTFKTDERFCWIFGSLCAITRIGYIADELEREPAVIERAIEEDVSEAAAARTPEDENLERAFADYKLWLRLRKVAAIMMKRKVSKIDDPSLIENIVSAYAHLELPIATSAEYAARMQELSKKPHDALAVLKTMFSFSRLQGIFRVQHFYSVDRCCSGTDHTHTDETSRVHGFMRPEFVEQAGGKLLHAFVKPGLGTMLDGTDEWTCPNDNAQTGASTKTYQTQVVYSETRFIFVTLDREVDLGGEKDTELKSFGPIEVPVISTETDVVCDPPTRRFIPIAYFMQPLKHFYALMLCRALRLKGMGHIVLDDDRITVSDATLDAAARANAAKIIGILYMREDALDASITHENPLVDPYESLQTAPAQTPSSSSSSSTAASSSSGAFLGRGTSDESSGTSYDGATGGRKRKRVGKTLTPAEVESKKERKNALARERYRGKKGEAAVVESGGAPASTGIDELIGSSDASRLEDGEIVAAEETKKVEKKKKKKK